MNCTEPRSPSPVPASSIDRRKSVSCHQFKSDPSSRHHPNGVLPAVNTDIHFLCFRVSEGVRHGFLDNPEQMIFDPLSKCMSSSISNVISIGTLIRSSLISSRGPAQVPFLRDKPAVDEEEAPSSRTGPQPTFPRSEPPGARFVKILIQRPAHSGCRHRDGKQAAPRHGARAPDASLPQSP